MNDGSRWRIGLIVVALCAWVGPAYAVGTSEDAYRRMLEGGSSVLSAVPPKAGAPPKSKTAKPAVQAAPKVGCDQKFAEI